MNGNEEKDTGPPGMEPCGTNPRGTGWPGGNIMTGWPEPICGGGDVT
jgi:hypothetical protein